MKINIDILNNDTYLTAIENKFKSTNKFKEAYKVRNNFFTVFELLSNENYAFDIPIKIQIPKPNSNKLRDIYIYNQLDSTLQKVISNALYDNFGAKVSNNVYSYKKGMSITNAVRYVSKNTDNLQYAKIDITNYFGSISIDVIDRLILDLFDEDLQPLMSSMYHRDQSLFHNKIVDEYLGLMPGSSLSCFLSNYVLKEVDAIMDKECELYVRYSDDILIGTKNNIKEKVELLESNLRDYGLTINPNKKEIYDKGSSITFLGLELYGSNIDISNNKMKTLKSVMYKNVIKYRKKIELNLINKDTALIKFLQVVYYYLVYSIIDNPLYIGLGGFIFGNINTTTKLKQLDYYLLDKARYIITGKNNKANVSKLNFNDLKEYGWKSLLDLYNLYHLDIDLYRNEVYIMRERLHEYRVNIETKNI